MPPRRAASKRQLARKDIEVIEATVEEQVPVEASSTGASSKGASSKEASSKGASSKGASKGAPKLKKAKSEGIARQATPRVAKPERGLHVVSWNVNGLRAVLKNHPKALPDLVQAENPDLLFLQETKLQASHVADYANLLPGYTGLWSCSRAKKGYSGTAVFVRGQQPHLVCETQAAADNEDGADASKKDKTSKGSSKKKPAASKNGDMRQFLRATKASRSAEPSTSDSSPEVQGATPTSDFRALSVQYGIKSAHHDQEGRTITVELPDLFVIGVYVPNSGQDLKRLDYRLNEWNVDFLAYIRELEASKPVLVVGDLNVAHLDLDIYNAGAKHLVKSAGCTPQERTAFTEFLDQGFTDTFRKLYPEHTGAFTYWSARTGGRQDSKGLRLDYAVCSNALLEANSPLRLVNSYQLDSVMGSDHCPIAIVLAHQ